MGVTISLKVHENLLKSIDEVVSNLSLTRSEWIRSTLAHAVKMEMTQDKIINAIAMQYLRGEISFDEMVDLIGYESARKIDAVAKGVETSIQKADTLALRIKQKKAEV